MLVEIAHRMHVSEPVFRAAFEKCLSSFGEHLRSDKALLSNSSDGSGEEKKAGHQQKESQQFWYYDPSEK